MDAWRDTAGVSDCVRGAKRHEGCSGGECCHGFENLSACRLFHHHFLFCESFSILASADCKVPAVQELWRTGRDSNPRISVLQTNALTTSPPVPFSIPRKTKTHRACWRVGRGSELDLKSIPRHTPAAQCSSTDTLRDGMRDSSSPVAESFPGEAQQRSRDGPGKDNVGSARFSVKRWRLFPSQCCMANARELLLSR